MEINKKEYFKIFKANFDFDIVDTEMGQAIKLPPKDAFIYSSVTGAGYFENPIYPFTPKGLLKLFYNAFDYKFVSGIFDNGVLKNTPYILSQAKKYLMEGDKYIIPIEFKSESKLISQLKEKFDDLSGRENYIIQRIETSKKGNGMEPFMEYLTGEYFKHHGFIVENQIPLAHSIGSPDFAGYGLGEIIALINKYGYLPRSGFHMVELALIRNFDKSVEDKSNKQSSEFIVGEAKTGTQVMTKQLEKYLNTGLYDKGFEIHPTKNKPSKEYFGLINLSSDFKIKITQAKSKYTASKPLSREDYAIWLGNYIKFYLIANLTNDELKLFYREIIGKEINKESDLIRFVQEINTKTILDKINSL